MTRRDALKNLGLFVAGSPLLHSQFIPRDTHQRVPSLDEITSAFEFEPVARAKILRASYDYITGGVEGEYSLRRNRKGFDWVTLIPRVVGGVSSVDLSTAVLRQQMPSPIFISPSSGHQRLHREGEKETHRGATAAGVTMIVSNESSFGTPEIAATAEGPLWQQLYIHRNLDAARERIDRAASSGCLAVCLTVDAQYSSLRERLTHNKHMNPVASSSWVCDIEVSISAVSFVVAKSLRMHYARRKEATSMPDSLEQLQQQRTDIVRQIGQLGDLRRGSITNTSGRCGKSNCRCHRPGQPAHGPNTRLTYKAGRKTVTESLPTPAALGKAEREVGEFRKFQQLSREFVELNTRICKQRPLEIEAQPPQEKKRPKRSSKKSRAS